LYLQEGKRIFYKSMTDLREETGEKKLSKAIAWHMRHEARKEVTYLKIAK